MRSIYFDSPRNFHNGAEDVLPSDLGRAIRAAWWAARAYHERHNERVAAASHGGDCSTIKAGFADASSSTRPLVFWEEGSDEPVYPDEVDAVFEALGAYDYAD